MKNFIVVLLIITFSHSFAQDSPAAPNIIVSTPELIQGEAAENHTVHIDINRDFISDAQIKVDSNGDFKHVYSNVLGSTVTFVMVWVEDAVGNASAKIIGEVKTASATLALVSDRNTSVHE